VFKQDIKEVFQKGSQRMGQIEHLTTQQHHLLPNHDQAVLPYLLTPIMVITAKRKAKQSQNRNRRVS